MMGYLPGMWHDFGVTIGSLAGALTGLLFVAVSIKSDTLSKSVSLSSRAAQTLVLFMTSALAAIVLVAPQPGDALGGELVALAAVSGTALYVLDRRGGHDQTSRVARYIERLTERDHAGALRRRRHHFSRHGRRRPVLADPRGGLQPGRRRDQRLAVPRPRLTAG
jgi:hypothetical protein